MAKMKSRKRNIAKIDEQDFLKRLDKLVDHIWTLQERLREMEQFERQWKSFFDRLKNKTGKDCKVWIHGFTAFRSFRWDGYHILLNDLHSLLHNEFSYQNSVINQMPFHLTIKTEEEYRDPHPKINFAGYISDEDRKRITEESIWGNARQLRKDSTAALQRLFPGSDVDALPNEAADIKERLRKLAARIESARTVFAHKHHEQIVRKHEQGLQSAGLDVIGEILNDLFKVVCDISFVAKSSTIMANDSDDYQVEVADQIDIILFGSISRAIATFYEGQPAEEFYFRARTKYYESDRVLGLITNSDS